jgi:hypothetical protein
MTSTATLTSYNTCWSLVDRLWTLRYCVDFLINIVLIYHRTNNPNLATPLRRQKEDYWIRELGTATPYGCNDKVDGIGILYSPTCRSVNVMDIFNSAPRRKRSHGHRHYASPIFHDVSLNDLLPFMQKPLGIHHIRSKLFSLPLSKLHALCNSCLVNNDTNPSTVLQKVVNRTISDLSYDHLQTKFATVSQNLSEFYLRFPIYDLWLWRLLCAEVRKSINLHGPRTYMYRYWVRCSSQKTVFIQR